MRKHALGLALAIAASVSAAPAFAQPELSSGITLTCVPDDLAAYYTNCTVIGGVIGDMETYFAWKGTNLSFGSKGPRSAVIYNSCPTGIAVGTLRTVTAYDGATPDRSSMVATVTLPGCSAPPSA